jgi:hypothetical protein
MTQGVLMSFHPKSTKSENDLDFQRLLYLASELGRSQPKSTRSKNDVDFEWLLCLARVLNMVKKGVIPRKARCG